MRVKKLFFLIIITMMLVMGVAQAEECETVSFDEYYEAFLNGKAQTDIHGNAIAVDISAIVGDTCNTVGMHLKTSDFDVILDKGKKTEKKFSGKDREYFGVKHTIVFSTLENHEYCYFVMDGLKAGTYTLELLGTDILLNSITIVIEDTGEEWNTKCVFFEGAGKYRVKSYKYRKALIDVAEDANPVDLSYRGVSIAQDANNALTAEERQLLHDLFVLLRSIVILYCVIGIVVNLVRYGMPRNGGQALANVKEQLTGWWLLLGIAMGGVFIVSTILDIALTLV